MRPLPVVQGKSLRRLDPASEWQILMEISERGLDGIERLGAMQDRAREEVAAADDAMSRVLADCAAAFMPAGAAPDLAPEHTADVQPPTARPLAA